MVSNLSQLGFLLFVSAIVAMLCRRLRMPYTVGLVLAGMALYFLHAHIHWRLSRDLIFSVFLPPLVFEAALFINWPEFRRDLPVVGLLATVGVALASAVTAAGMHFFLDWPWGTAAVFGILIAATDPVSVIATFKEAGVQGRLRLLIDAESLLNDGTAAVAFVVALGVLAGAEAGVLPLAGALLLTIAGGVLIGGALAFALMLLAGRSPDYLVEITFTTLAAYGSFFVAEKFHTSGVLAALTAGLVVGNFHTSGSISAAGRQALGPFWEYTAFVANSLIFLLLGAQEAEQHFAGLWIPVLVAIALVTLGRAVAIYPVCAVFARTSLKVDHRHQHVLFWGGLRGALALALALALPPDMDHRDTLITITFAVVAFSVFAQGLTLPLLLRRLGQVSVHPVVALIALLAVAGLPAPAAAQVMDPVTDPGSAPAGILRVMQAARLPAATVSFAVAEADGGRLVLGLNTGSPRSPASTIKLLTTFASLDILGPAYTWHTRALLRGVLRDGVLDGDLILQGGGDPYMTLERWWAFAHRLRVLGLRSISGDVVIDNTGFSAPGEDPGAFDGRPNRAYNVLPDALMVNFQAVDFSLVPNQETRSIEIVADPAPVNLTIDNRLRFVDGRRCSGAASRVDFQVTSARWDRVAFSGALSGRCAPRRFTRVLLTPADYAYGTFATLWRECGGAIHGGMRVAAAPADARLFLDFDSLTLGEIVRLTNKYSSNLMARHLLLTLGRERFGAPATQEKGLAAVADWSRMRGLDFKDLDLGNGSGLSRTTQVSVLQLAEVLRAAYHSRYAPEFMASLPLGGIDGTLRTRMQSSPAGAVRLKTGHIDGVSGVAGYVTTAARTYVVVCLVNDVRADYGAAEPLHAALVDWVLANL